jgi:hypothetical protein
MAFTLESRDNYDTRHGGPFDRGSADSYYGRGRNPHYYVGGTGTSERVETLTPAEVQAYLAGYQYNEQFGDKKSWD